MPLHCSYYDIACLFALLLPLGLWAKELAMSISYLIPSFGLYCLVFLLGQSIPYLGLPWPISFFGHLWLISSFSTSFIPMSFCWILWTSLTQEPYLYLWAYWPLSQPHLLIPFFWLSRPIFTFFPSLTIPMGLLLHSLGLSRLVCFLSGLCLLSLRPLIILVGLLTIISTILAQWFLFYYSYFPSFSYC